MSSLDEDTLNILRDELVKYIEVFNLTQSELVLIRDAWEYAISQANIPKWIKEDTPIAPKSELDRLKERNAENYCKKPITVKAWQTDEELYIQTLEGVMKANKGDYIIQGVKGEYYPCKSDVFKETYEEVQNNK